ncbi:MAG: Flp pilus assembly complex ATPase component TadA [Desulfobacterales bacterium]|nr:Flp pilus assembly complex ATPase component TadA [Desulfobacterales bacterium]MBF0395690.1 Flp pilus assembly complex ATPase component TadA [Desulfobacterales bacterium]
MNQVKSTNSTDNEANYWKRFQEMCNKFHAASEIDEILIDLKDEIISFFEAERLTVYVVEPADGLAKYLVSRFKSGNETKEIRIPFQPGSIAGYAASKTKIVNIANAYDDDELSKISKEIKFDNRWDKLTGFTTKAVLAAPITFKTFILGAIQFINRKDGGRFTKRDEQSLIELAKSLGIAFYNQKKLSARTKPTRFDYLLERNLITLKELDKAIVDSRQRKDPIENILIKEYGIQKRDLGASLSQFYRVPFVEYNEKTPIPGELLSNIKVPFMKSNLWVPLKSDGNKIIIAIDNPNDLQKIDDIKSLFTAKNILFCVAFKKDILDFIELFTKKEDKINGVEIDQIVSQMEQESDDIIEAEKNVGEEDSVIVQLVNKIILDAYKRNASDIHVEPYPGKNNTEIRFRVDGDCALYQTIPYSYRNALSSRIKIMADMDISERRKPQDGKIKFKKYGGLDIELRVATIPTQGEMEDVVMRILASGDPLPLDKMGFSKRNYENFTSAIEKPYGIVLVCGPTGSGKTTTLHSGLAYINKPDTKIWTAEDPVEITQKGLRQVQVKPKIGFDFAAALRAFLRADPDVIMVGEMRDQETAHIGIEASLTGHLVFSTLHTNSAPETITRLLDMGLDPFNFADAILCILAQRLGRTLCKTCKQSFHPSKAEYDELVREYGETFTKNLNIPYTDKLTLNKPVGCEACGNSGYKGRIGLHELLMGTDEMKQKIQFKSKMEVIREQAIKDGMTTLKQDGIEKIFAGNCNLLQIRTVCIK